MPPEEEALSTTLSVTSLRRTFEAFLRNLFDLQFRQLITPRMLPTLYLLSIAASAFGMLAYSLSGFAQSAWTGLLRLLFVTPVGFLVLVTVSRITLEFLMVVFRIAVNVSEMSGHTGDIAGGLPRIQFWKGLFSGPRSRDDD